MLKKGIWNELLFDNPKGPYPLREILQKTQILQLVSERRELILDVLKGNKELGEDTPDREVIGKILDNLEGPEVQKFVAELESPEFQKLPQELNLSASTLRSTLRSRRRRSGRERRSKTTVRRRCQRKSKADGLMSSGA